MTAERPPAWPAKLSPFVAYRPPLRSRRMRSESPRDVCADVRRFLDRAAKLYAFTGDTLRVTAQRWSAKSASGKMASVYGEWPSECTTANFAAAVHLAQVHFGEPQYRSSPRRLEGAGLEFDWTWRVSAGRVDEVLEFLESVPSCTGGEFAPVRAHFGCLFVLRDLDTERALPEQGMHYYPLLSTLDVDIQRSCRGRLAFTLPFGEPNETVANYVVALQEHAPVWLDPRYFDQMAPAMEGPPFFHFTRLPPSWIGVTPAGDLRLDASRSGIVPVEVDLPTDAEIAAEDRTRDDALFQSNYAAVASAILDLSRATLLIRGTDDTEHMVKHAAERFGMSLRIVRTIRISKSLSLEEELRTLVAGLDGRPTLLLLEIVPYAEPETNAALLSQMAARVLMGVQLPPAVRLLVSVEMEPSDDARVAAERWDVAKDEGFGTRQQLDFLKRQASRAAQRDVVIEVLRLPPGSG